jgi:tetratricopeptide (TPR) repeat protein/predicted aspartyl protease
MRETSRAVETFGGGMFRRWVLGALAGCGLVVSAGAALADCTIGKLAELPVTMVERQPVVSAKINGMDALFLADSGAFYSLITHANADKYHLTLEAAPFGFSLGGLTGSADAEIGTAKDFALGRIELHRVQFLVGGGEVGAETAGVLGQNVFHAGDVEYDLADGAIRLFKPHGCENTLLAYWITPGQAYAFIPIEQTSPIKPHTIGDVYVNGVRLRATFDTGASSSMLTLHAAARAGIKPGGPGVVAGERMYGIGQRTAPTWIAPVNSFKIGQEEIKNTHLMISDMESDTDMLVGADFFLSHRVYVATSQSRMYVSYRGGPVFSLRAVAVPAPEAAPASGFQTASASPPPPEPKGDEPTDAAGFARRGAAFIARHEMEKALPDLNRAVELAPTEPSYFYRRAVARVANRQLALAKEDLDQTLKLKPDDFQALLLRAQIEMVRGNRTGSLADLDTVDKLISKQDDARLQMAEFYQAGGRLETAVAQYDLWIGEHAVDNRIAQARNGRCWARALLGQDLDKALDDCNAALHLAPHTAEMLDSRGLVYLRRGEFDRAISDYDAALKLSPQTAWSYYGRGVAKLHKGMKAEGDADITTAVALAPKLSDFAKARGIAP